MERITGRIEEQETMRMLLKDPESQFLVVYGRRRVGKTFLVRNVYKDEIVFQVTGMANTEPALQLINFFTALKIADPALTDERPPANWFEAFISLRIYLEKIKEKKKVVFLDELPWMARGKSDLMYALEHFWNSWASAQGNIVLVVCGSAASWIINKLLRNTGGLYNRVTQRIKLMPFTLSETETFFESRNIVLDRYQIIQLYMAIGGIPFYLDKIRKGRSVAQEIDRLCFSDNAMLASEYDLLYKSLFNRPERHIAIVEALSKKDKGLTRDELIKESKLSNGGNTTKALSELKESGFITRSYPFGKRVKTALYRLSDPYSLFYLKFIKDRKVSGKGSWLSRIDDPSWKAWSGYAYENICQLHIESIKKALGISGVYTEVSSWMDKDRQVRIDLLLDRRDRVINLCEVKFSQNVFTITKSYREQLQKKVFVFKDKMKTNKSVFLTMITTFGLTQNIHSTGFVQNTVTINDLFIV